MVLAGRRRRVRRALGRLTPRERRHLGGMGASVAALHVLGWGLLALTLTRHYRLSGDQIFGFGTGLVAYTLGMRHAFDADHIAAIDNTTRKLMAEGKRPLSVGFWFSLGHSSIVFALAVGLNFGVRALNSAVRSDNSSLHHVTGIVGASVSGAFLYLIAILNVVVLVSIVKVVGELRRGRYNEAELERQLDQRGLMNRFLAPLAARIDRPGKMFGVGVLFGLGFDTASEVALLVLAGSAVIGGLPFYAILALPLLFAAGMSLLDTIDGCFMSVAYDWAFSRPVRKLYYNLTITGLSVFVAFFVGSVELLGVLAQQAGLSGPFWNVARGFNINTAGFVIVGVFLVTWVGALLVWRVGRIEERWGPPADLALTPAGDVEDGATAGRDPALVA